MSRRDANSSDILKYVKLLKKFYTSASPRMEDSLLLSATVKALVENMNSYFERYENDPNLILATFLDPHHKFRWWADVPVDSPSPYSENNI